MLHAMLSIDAFIFEVYHYQYQISRIFLATIHKDQPLRPQHRYEYILPRSKELQKDSLAIRFREEVIGCKFGGRGGGHEEGEEES